MIGTELAAVLAGEIAPEALRVIELDGRELTDEESHLLRDDLVQVLERAANAERVDVRHFNLEFIQLPVEMHSLVALELGHCHLVKLTLPEQAPELSALTVVHNDLQTLAINIFPKLEILAISGNTDLKRVQLERFSKLHTLHARQLPQLDWQYVSPLHQLMVLHIDCRNPKQLSQLPPNLKALHLSFPTLSELRLEQLPVTLEGLAITRSPFLQTLELPPLPNLKSLDISYNSLASMPDLTKLPQLEAMKAKGNLF